MCPLTCPVSYDTNFEVSFDSNSEGVGPEDLDMGQDNKVVTSADTRFRDLCMTL